MLPFISTPVITMASLKRLQNDISFQEDLSDRRVPSNSYYIILIQSQDAPPKSIASLAKRLIKEMDALCVYVYERSMYLLFSAVEDGTHYLSGNHHALCSKYTSLAVLDLGLEVSTKIIELETKTKVLVYFYGKIYENMKQTAIQKSNGKIDKKDITQLTFGEIKKELMSRCAVNWERLTNDEKFGTFYKYISEPKAKYVAMSEMINISTPDRYMEYLFD